MKIPLSWLSDFMDINHSPQEYVDMLNQLGFEVEGIERPGGEIRGVIIVKVLGTNPHPDADRLKLVDVDTGTEQKTIVCGAPNVREGLTVAYAPSGATLPGGFTLEAKKIRGIISDGMLCSTRELSLGEDHAGIMELSSDLVAGSDACEALGLDDTIIEVSITPNRPDAMSIVGIARELCAGFNQQLKLPNVDKFLDGIPVDESLPQATVVIEDTEKCPRFVGRTLGVQVGPSPEWMVRRLQKADQKTINNVVDVTNYVMLEWGRPLHVFDADILGSTDIVVRRASKGEKLTLLDESERVLDETDLVIATPDGAAHSLAGIMGGQDSGTYETTKTIYLESAYWSPETISKSSKRLGVRSESSARFERGVDPNFAAYGAHRACQLLAEVAKAKMSPVEVDMYPNPITPKTITLRSERVERVLGDAVPASDIKSFLEPLVVDIKEKKGVFDITVPTFRPDLTREIDLIEEVARRRGLNTLEPTLPNSLVQVGGLSRDQHKRRVIEDALVGAGLSEAYTLPLEAEEIYAPFGFSADDLVRAKNPLRSDASVLRPFILPGLMKSVNKNISRGISDIAFFEMGHVFHLPFDENFQPREATHLSVVLSGNIDTRPHGRIREVDVFDAIDILNVVTDTLRLPRAELRDVPGGAAFHPTRSNDVYNDGKKFGVVGELIGDVKAVGFELNVDILLEFKERDMTYVPSSNLPFVSFDLAFVVDESTSVQSVEKALREHGGVELEHLHLFDIFQGGTLESGKKSLAFAVRVRPQSETFNDEQLAAYRARVIDGVSKDCNAQLR
ncbi:MAG TPA: phenylalanine--tRNA ligase subunit beta [Acidimicrobiia bacterium]|nr:phenylalanine--tRNA ligase subunit beta [Acidimicrobiia bacterium]